ncbi:MAG: PorT family protein [candidate division Zixibacteria bacterium]|nr:PorT family protein [candidate division Zixibacteria bacterium]
MKKTLLLLSVFLAVAPQVLPRSVSYGIKGGLALSNQDFDYTDVGDPDFDNYMGFEVGLFAELPLISKASAAAGLSYTQRGLKVKSLATAYAGRPVTVESRSHLDYLSLWAALKVHLAVGSGRTYLLAGPRLDLKIGTKGEFSDLYDDFSGSVFGGTIGLGQEYSVRVLTLLLEVTYSMDFSEAYTSTLLTVKNRSFGFLAGVKF